MKSTERLFLAHFKSAAAESGKADGSPGGGSGIVDSGMSGGGGGVAPSPQFAGAGVGAVFSGSAMPKGIVPMRGGNFDARGTMAGLARSKRMAPTYAGTPSIANVGAGINGRSGTNAIPQARGIFSSLGNVARMGAGMPTR